MTRSELARHAKRNAKIREACKSHSMPEVAEMFRMSIRNVYNVLHFEPSKAPPEIERKCLRCRTEFTARGKFNRICKTCKDSLEYHESIPAHSVAYPQGAS